MIVQVFKNIWYRIKNAFIDIYHDGIGNLIAERRWFKAILDVGLIVLFVFCAITYPLTLIMIVFSYGFLMTILNRVTATEDGFVLVDLTKPFLTVFLLTWVRSISFISSVISIPLMTRQMEKR
ncbi:MAG: hypothetical protein DRQ78_08455, partial [Epsilonproteobacteria bacterium]